MAALWIALVPAGVEAAAGVPGLRVLTSDATGVTLEYRLPDHEIVLFETPRGPASRVRVPGLGATAEPGRPETPAGGAWVALPPTGTATLRILEQETETVTGIDLAPVYRPGFREEGENFWPTREYARDEAAYASDALVPGSPAALADVQWLRFQRVQALRLLPVQYRAASRTLVITRRMVLRVEFPAADRSLDPRALGSAGLESGPREDRFFEGVYRGAVVNYEQGRAFRARRARRPGLDVERGTFTTPRSANQGTGNAEWKVRVDTTGVWRVDFAQLAARGWPAGIAVDAVAAFYRDTTVNLQPQPWTMVEVPIDLVDANGNTTFDAGDYVVLPVQNWADRVQPSFYERRYGDAEIFWLSWKSAGSGLRVRTEPGWFPAQAPATPTSFPSIRRYERNFFYVQYPANVTTSDQFFWVDGFIDGTPIDTLFADVLDLDTAAGDATVRAEWIGNTNGQHFVSGTWVSGAGETALWTDQQLFSKNALVLEATIAASLLSEGRNNLRISGRSSGTVGSGAPFNWFELTHPRLYRARNDRLSFTNGGVSDTVEIVVENFGGASPPQILLYEVTNWNDPVRLTVDPAQVESQGSTWRFRFRDVVPGGATRRYAAASNVARVPDAAITAETPSALHATAPGGADFVILAHAPLADACEPLADFRRGRGIGTLVAKAQDVYDEFNGGRKSHFAIRRFLRYAIDNWDTRFCLFVGDASEDARGFLGTSAPDYLPSPMIQGAIPVSPGFEAVPSDNWYATRLTGPPGPEEDLLVDLIVGRWTVDTPAAVQALVDKSVAYESTDLDGAWRNRAVLVADDDYSSQTTFGGGGGGFEYCQRNSERIFKTINERVAQMIREEAGFRDYDVRPFYLTDKLASLPSFPGQSCPTSRDFNSTIQFTESQVSPELFVLLSQGAAFVNYQGHGNVVQMTHEEVYLAFQFRQDIDLIFNDGKPWVFSGYACHLNNFAGVREGGPFGDGLAERMVNAPAKGAIASFASTGFELLPFNADNHLNVHFHRAFFADPPFERFAGQVGARVLVGEAAALGVARMVASTFNLERRAAETYVFLGDPLASMSFGAPRFFASAADQDSIASGIPYFPTTSDPRVLVDVEVVDESFLETLTVTEQGEGARPAVPDSELVFTPTFPDTTSGKRYVVQYGAVPRPASYDLVFTASDRSGLTGQFVLRLRLEAVLTQQGQSLGDGDATISGVEHVWKVRSPAQLGASDFAVFVNGDAVPATATATPGDTTGRSWEVRFTPDLQDGENTIRLGVAEAAGGVSRSVTVNLSPGLEIAQAFAFPNPFRDLTTFNFNLTGDRATDVRLRVFTVSGKLVFERTERQLVPGYYQWPWTGADASGQVVSHGVYLFRLAAINDDGTKNEIQGKVVRAPLARPREEDPFQIGGGGS